MPDSLQRFFQQERIPLLVLFVCALLTVAAWHTAQQAQEQRSAERFAYAMDDAKVRILQRMASYEQVLRGGVALFDASPSVLPDRETFQRYVQTLNTNEHFPGIQGIGFALMFQPGEVAGLEKKIQAEGFPQFQVRPAGPRDIYSAIIYLEPMDSRNLRAFGFDMYSETTRRAAMDLARDTGQSAVSGRVILVQETAEDIQAGFLMYLPVYRKGMPTHTQAQRRAALLGFVYSPFRARDLMAGILGMDAPEVAFELYDANTRSRDNLLYDSDNNPQDALSYPLHRWDSLGLPNHQWAVLFHSTPNLLTHTTSRQPLLIAIAGAVVSILLFLSVLMINHSRHAMRKLAEERGRRQQESEASLAAIVAGSDDAIISKDLKGIVTSWNPGAEKLFGYRADEMLGQPIFKIIPPDKIEEERDVFIELIKYNHVQHIETLHQHKNGNLVEISATLSPIKDAQGNVIGASKIARDISARKRIEQNLAQAKDNADKANRAKSEFLANMSHEIRTPMNGILGLSQLLASTELTPLQRDYLKNIQQSSRNLLNILNDILDYSKIEAGKLMLAHIPFDVDQLLFGVSGLFNATAAEKKITLQIEQPATMPNRFYGDPSRISQILNNLLSNALKFTEQGSITLKMNHQPGQLHFCVTDTGIGMSEEQRQNLFQIFQQADTSSTRKYGGAGLGLSISKRLIDMMHGEISVSSTLGVGSEFRFYIQAQSINQDSNSLKKQQLKDLRVLIAEEDSYTRKHLQQALNSWGMGVVACADGQSAQHEIRQAASQGTPFDLIMLNWQIPVLDGLSLACQIREHENISHSNYHPIILMCTLSEHNRLLELSAGVAIDDILEKPFNLSNLLNVLLKIFTEPEQDELTTARNHCLPIKGKRILLVEDNDINQLVASSMLENIGMQVDIVENGQLAVERTQHTTYDLVLMDLHMPVMDGLTATQCIREKYSASELPIIAMTAAAFEKDKQKCYAAGMNDHIAKPVEISLLCDVLLKWLR